MRQTILILIVALLAVSAAAEKINCTALATPTTNVFKPDAACSADPQIASCDSVFANCINSTDTCAYSLKTCLVDKMRCLSLATPTLTACNAWFSAISNDKLYLAAGGDFAGSAMELSCKKEICAINQTCTQADEANVCFEPNTTISGPPMAPVGAVVVTFTITGNKTLLGAWLAKDEAKAKLIIGRMLALMLGTDASNIVILSIKVGSLVIDFYTTDSTLDVATVKDKLTAAKGNADQAQYFSELAADAGMSVSDLGVGEFTVETATAAPGPTASNDPSPAGDTPSPLAPGSANGMGVAIAAVLMAITLLM